MRHHQCKNRLRKSSGALLLNFLSDFHSPKQAQKCEGGHYGWRVGFVEHVSGVFKGGYEPVQKTEHNGRELHFVKHRFDQNNTACMAKM